MNHRAKFLFRPLFFIVIVAALSAVVMLLWNAVLPGLFGTALPIDYWHALGLLVLCRILFGGFGRGCSRSRFGVTQTTRSCWARNKK